MTACLLSIALLAQTLPPSNEQGVATWSLKQVMTILTPAILLLLGQLMTWLKARNAETAGDKAVASARSAESHARETNHNTRDVPLVRRQLAHLMAVLPDAIKPEEEIVDARRRATLAAAGLERPLAPRPDVPPTEGLTS